MAIVRENLTLQLTFTGKNLVMSGSSIKEFAYPAASGDATHKTIPVGDYWINSDEIHEITPLTDASAKVLVVGKMLLKGKIVGYSKVDDAHSAAWGAYRIPIYQTAAQEDATGRNNMFIHGGTSYGSAGCIDLQHWMDAFVSNLKKATTGKIIRIPLKVAL